MVLSSQRGVIYADVIAHERERTDKPVIVARVRTSTDARYPVGTVIESVGGCIRHAVR